jgi:hypothetical protein
LSIAQSGFYTQASGRSLTSLIVNGQPTVAAGQNRDFLKLFQVTKSNTTPIKITAEETHAILTFRNGAKRKEEYPFGQGFLSQSTRYVMLHSGIASIDIFAGAKISRTIKP